MLHADNTDAMSLTTTPETEVVNVTLPSNATSLAKQQFVASLIFVAIVRYVFPIVIIIGNVTSSHSLFTLWLLYSKKKKKKKS